MRYTPSSAKPLRCVGTAAGIAVFALLACAVRAEPPPPPRQAPPPTSIPPDPALLDRIEQAFRGDQVQFCKNIEELKQAAGGDQKRLLLQLVVHQARHAGQEKYGWDLALVLPHLQLGASEMVEAFAPYLGTADAGQRALMESFLGGPEPPHPDVYMDAYGRYLSSIRGRHDPPPPLVAFMYRQSAAGALHVMRGAYNRDRDLDRKLLWSEHVVSDYLWKRRNGFDAPADAAAADAQLAALAQAEQWWVRLYVAETLRRQPDALDRSGGLIGRLRADANELVRTAASHSVPPAESVERYRVGGAATTDPAGGASPR